MRSVITDEQIMFQEMESLHCVDYLLQFMDFLPPPFYYIHNLLRYF